MSLKKASPIITLDLSAPLEEVFTNGFRFQEAICQAVKKSDIIRIATYNIGINVSTEHVSQFLARLCQAKEVHLLVRRNNNHPANFEITLALQTLVNKHENLSIKVHPKMHVKAVILNTLTCYVGSLNLITPSLEDL